MHINSKFLVVVGAASALIGIGLMAACTSDSDPVATGGAGGGVVGGAGGSVVNGGAGGSTVGAGGSSAASAVVCSKPIVLDATKALIANFDGYDSVSDLSTWSFSLGDSSSGIYAGTFGYGDRTGNKSEKFAMVPGAGGTTYALDVADTNAVAWGGGMGIWISECLNATKFSGISFWVKGNAPTGQAKFTILMKETTAATASKAGNKIGTCTGTDTGGDAATCVHPFSNFTVTTTWTEVKIPWASFTAGKAPEGAVQPDGRNIWQVQFDIGLVWQDNGTGTYVPVAAPYDLAVDTISFY